MKMKRANLISTIAILESIAAIAENPPPRPAPRLVLSVTSPAWADGAEIPMKYSSRGDNKSPAFEFHWSLGPDPAGAPDTLQTYAVIFHDVENSSNKTTVDTLHWAAFNIPGTAKGLSEGLGSGDLADGMRNGPGIALARGNAAAYFGPGAGRTWAATSLCVRVLRSGYEARSAGEDKPRGSFEGDGWSCHRQSRVVWPFPRASPIDGCCRSRRWKCSVVNAPSAVRSSGWSADREAATGKERKPALIPRAEPPCDGGPGPARSVSL
jgi:phosphatidylethanolamine-binding protein (PEBP) family uncharacterized protein